MLYLQIGHTYSMKCKLLFSCKCLSTTLDTFQLDKRPLLSLAVRFHTLGPPPYLWRSTSNRNSLTYACLTHPGAAGGRPGGGGGQAVASKPSSLPAPPFSAMRSKYSVVLLSLY